MSKAIILILWIAVVLVLVGWFDPDALSVLTGKVVGNG
jgi:hypothetical protein